MSCSRKKQKGQKNMQKSLRIIASLTVALSLIIIFHSLFIIDANLIKELEVNIKTGKVIGFDVNTTALTFGRIPPGSTSIREITITNTKNKPVKIILKAEGEAQPFISFQENNIPLQPLETKKIKVYATAPSNSKKNEEYTGKVKIYSSNK